MADLILVGRSGYKYIYIIYYQIYQDYDVNNDANNNEDLIKTAFTV